MKFRSNLDQKIDCRNIGNPKLYDVSSLNLKDHLLQGLKAERLEYDSSSKAIPSLKTLSFSTVTEKDHIHAINCLEKNEQCKFSDDFAKLEKAQYDAIKQVSGTAEVKLPLWGNKLYASRLTPVKAKSGCELLTV